MRKNTRNHKTDIAALGASLIASTMAAHTEPADTPQPNPTPAPQAQPPIAAVAVPPPPTPQAAPQTASPTTVAQPTAAEPSTPAADNSTRVFVNLGPTLSNHIFELKMSLARNGIRKKVNDTQICRWALSRLPAQLTPELSQEFAAFVAKSVGH